MVLTRGLGNYNDLLDGGVLLGQIYSSASETIRRNGYNGTDSTIIPAGFGVAIDGTEDSLNRTSPALILPTSTSVIRGVAFLPQKLEKTPETIDSNGYWGYPPDYEVGYITKGDIPVIVDEDVSNGDPVFCRHSDGLIGSFRTDADGGDAVQVGVLSTARFISDATVDSVTGLGVAIVSLNLA